MLPKDHCRTQDWVMDPIHYYFSLPEGKNAFVAYQVLMVEINHYLNCLNDEKAMIERIQKILKENEPKPHGAT